MVFYAGDDVWHERIIVRKVGKHRYLIVTPDHHFYDEVLDLNDAAIIGLVLVATSGLRYFPLLEPSLYRIGAIPVGELRSLLAEAAKMKVAESEEEEVEEEEKGKGEEVEPEEGGGSNAPRRWRLVESVDDKHAGDQWKHAKNASLEKLR